MFDFLSPRSNEGLKFESLVWKMFDFLSPKSNKGLKFETLVRKKFGFLSPSYTYVSQNLLFLECKIYYSRKKTLILESQVKSVVQNISDS